MQIDGAVCRACLAGRHGKCEGDEDRCGCMTICTCDKCWPTWEPTDEELEAMRKDVEK